MQILYNKCTWWFEYDCTWYFLFLSSNLIPDYSTQQLSAVNDGPGIGGGTGIYLDHNQYSISSSRGGNIMGTDFGSKTAKHVPPGEKLDFSSPSLYTNSSGGLGKHGLMHIVFALAISALTSILFSYSQHFSRSPSCRLYHDMKKNKKFMRTKNVDRIRMKTDTDHIQNIQYLKECVAHPKYGLSNNSNGSSNDSCNGFSNQNKKGSMVCVLCI